MQYFHPLKVFGRVLYAPVAHAHYTAVDQAMYLTFYLTRNLTTSALARKRKKRNKNLGRCVSKEVSEARNNLCCSVHTIYVSHCDVYLHLWDAFLVLASSRARTPDECRCAFWLSATTKEKEEKKILFKTHTDTRARFWHRRHAKPKRKRRER